MPIQLGGPSLPKPKPLPKPKLINPATYNQQAYVPGGSSPAVAKAIQNMGIKTGALGVNIPQASSIVPPGGIPGGGGGTQASTDPYGDEFRADPMTAIAKKNYEDTLAMGERSQLRDPIAQLVSTYGYDPRSYLAAHPDASLPQGALDLANRYLDPAGLAAAAKDPTTVANQISHGFGQALAGIPTNLAEHGLENSGSSAIMSNNLTYQRALQDRQAMDQFLSGLGTANSNWTNFQTNAAEAYRKAQEDIMTRLANQPGYHGEEDPSTKDYSGGAASIYQPAPDVQGVMDKGQLSGQWDSWAQAMENNINAANKPKPAPVFKVAPATAKLIQKMRGTGEVSSWEKAMQKLGG